MKKLINWTVTMKTGDAKHNDLQTTKVAAAMGAMAGFSVGTALCYGDDSISFAETLKRGVIGAIAGAGVGCAAAAIVKVAVADFMASNSVPKPEEV